jgi:hypothetical protein
MGLRIGLPGRSHCFCDRMHLDDILRRDLSTAKTRDEADHLRALFL